MRNKYRHIGQPFCVLSPQINPPPALLSENPPHTFHLKCDEFWCELLQWPRCEPMSVQDLVFYPPTFTIWSYSGEAVLSSRSQNSRCCGAVSNSFYCAGTGSQHGEAAGSTARLLNDRNGEGIPTLGSLQLRAAPCMYPYLLIVTLSFNLRRSLRIDYIASCGRMSDEWWKGTGTKWSWTDRSVSPAIAWRDRGEPWKTSVTIAGVPVGIRTENLRNEKCFQLLLLSPEKQIMSPSQKIFLLTFREWIVYFEKERK